MPQASDEDRERIQDRFGTIDCYTIWRYLQKRGYTENKGYITLPTPLHKITKEEGECIDFLCDEWDYAFVTTPA